MYTLYVFMQSSAAVFSFFFIVMKRIFFLNRTVKEKQRKNMKYFFRLYRTKWSNFVLDFAFFKNIEEEIKFCWSNKLKACDGFLTALSRWLFRAKRTPAFKCDELKKCCWKLFLHSFLPLSLSSTVRLFFHFRIQS